MPSVCVACATERLENRQELKIHKMKVLREFSLLLKSERQEHGVLIKMLQSDRRVLEHLCGIILGAYIDY